MPARAFVAARPRSLACSPVPPLPGSMLLLLLLLVMVHTPWHTQPLSLHARTAGLLLLFLSYITMPSASEYSV